MINWPVLRDWHNWIVVAFALVLLAALGTMLQPFNRGRSTIGAFDDGF